MRASPQLSIKKEETPFICESVIHNDVETCHDYSANDLFNHKCVTNVIMAYNW